VAYLQVLGDTEFSNPAPRPSLILWAFLKGPYPLPGQRRAGLARQASSLVPPSLAAGVGSPGMGTARHPVPFQFRSGNPCRSATRAVFWQPGRSATCAVH